MEHVLLTRELEFEHLFFQTDDLEGKKIVLRSGSALNDFLNKKNCASVIIDEHVLSFSRRLPAQELQSLYQALIQHNPKCLIIILYKFDSLLPTQITKKSHYTVFFRRDSISLPILNYLFEVNRHQDHRAVFTLDLRPTTSSPVDLHLYHPLNDNYPRFIPKDHPLEAEIIARLKSDNVSQLFVKSKDFSDFLRTNQNRKHLFFSQELHHIRKRYKYFLTEIIDDAQKGEWSKGRILLEELEALYQSLVQLVMKFDGPENALKKLTFLRKTPIAQGLNCATYAIIFARILGIRNEKDLCFSALLYAVGKSTILPQDSVRGPLNNVDLVLRSSYLRYVDASLEIIKNKKIKISQTVLETVKSHKEYFDGSGYPQGLSGDDIPLNAQLIGLIESLNNLYSFRQSEKFLSFKRAWLALKENSKSSILEAKHSKKLIEEIENRLVKKGVLSFET